MKNVDKCIPLLGLLIAAATAQAQEERRTFTLRFEAGSVTLVADTANERELTRLERTLCDSSLLIRRAELFATASIEGSYARNEQLARRRVQTLRRTFDRQYNLSARMPVDTRWVAENWEGLERCVAASDMPRREEILHIIRAVPVMQGRERYLMQLDDGRPYLYMKTCFFPILRQMRVTLTVSPKHLSPQVVGSAASAGAAQGTDAAQSAGASPLPPFRVRVLIKSDLLALAGITPEIGYRAPMPNIEVELLLSRHFSLAVGALYKEGLVHAAHHRRWNVTAYTLEARYRPFATRYADGFYTGAYFRVGDYNIRPADTGQTGRYREAGVSLGYTLSLSRRWLLEGGCAVGYQHADVKRYLRQEGGDYPQGRHTVDRFTLTNLFLRIGYRL
jgi:hypothetical protein